MTDTIFTAAHDREARVSADRQRITHRAGAWSATYTPEELVRWLAFYEQQAAKKVSPTYDADVEVLRKARALVAP